MSDIWNEKHKNILDWFGTYKDQQLVKELTDLIHPVSDASSTSDTSKTSNDGTPDPMRYLYRLELPKSKYKQPVYIDKKATIPGLSIADPFFNIENLKNIYKWWEEKQTHVYEEKNFKLKNLKYVILICSKRWYDIVIIVKIKISCLMMRYLVKYLIYG